MKKKELHVKKVHNSYMVCFKDNKVWRGLSPLMPRDDAVKCAERLAKNKPHEFLQTVCNCGSEAT